VAKDISNEKANLHCRKCGFITIIPVRRLQTNDDDKDLHSCPNCGGKSYVTGALIVTEEVK